MPLVAAAEQTAAVRAKYRLDVVWEIVGSKLLLALHLVFKVFLGRCRKQVVLHRVNLASTTAGLSVQISDDGLFLDKALVSTHEKADDLLDRDD